MREERLINARWKFSYGDFPGAAEASFDDSEWYDVNIPHSFSTPYFMEREFYTGYGCYRKTLEIKPEWLEREIYLVFQAAFQDAEVYVNGSLAATHRGGYTAFLARITPFVRAGENLLFVRLNNLWNPRIAPRGGEHVFSGGLYRDVSVLAVDPLHVAWCGTFVKTPLVSWERATLRFETEIENMGAASKDITLESSVYFGDDRVFQNAQRRALAGGETARYLAEGEIVGPKLWHPDHPNLYHLVSRVSCSGALVDEHVTAFGIRWFEFTKDQGFFFNGEHYDIQGVNAHQDHAGWGDAVTRAGLYRDAKMIKDCGMNFVRGSHYPHHPAFAEACDAMGLLFWSELCYWGTAGEKTDGYWTASAYPIRPEDERDFEENCMETLREMIRQNRNSPSIVVWSMGNEIFFSREDVMDKARALVVKLVALSHTLDDTRPAGVGGTQRGGFDHLGDVAGYNGDGAALFLDPGVPNMVSEYGSRISDRPGELTPNFSDNADRAYPWRSGKALWCAFHHGSIFGDMGHMGMIDYFRLPLGSWHWYRWALLGIEPPVPRRPGVPHALRLRCDRTEIRTDGTDDAQIVVSLIDREGHGISGDLAVTLTNESGGRFPTGRSIVLSRENRGFLDGQGAIEFRAYSSGINRITAEA